MAPDDEDDGDLYDDEFDFVDEDDDDLSDLDDEDDSAVDDDSDDSELDRAADRGADAADSELDEEPAPRPAPARRGRGGEHSAADDQRDLFDRGRDDRGRDDRDRDDRRRDDRDEGERGGGERDDRRRDDRHEGAEAAEAAPPEDLGPPPPPANYRVHIYEYEEFKRTIDRPFTAEDAEAFASEFNRTSKAYGRFALAGKDDAKPKKTLD